MVDLPCYTRGVLRGAKSKPNALLGELGCNGQIDKVGMARLADSHLQDRMSLFWQATVQVRSFRMTEDLSNVNCDGMGLEVEVRVRKKQPYLSPKTRTLGIVAFPLNIFFVVCASERFPTRLLLFSRTSLRPPLMVLARLLAPRNFGLVAMFTAVTNVFIVVAHAGQIVDDIRPERAVERFSRLALGEQVEDVGGGLPYVGRNGE
jgi:hypothetical protein